MRFSFISNKHNSRLFIFHIYLFLFFLFSPFFSLAFVTKTLYDTPMHDINAQNQNSFIFKHLNVMIIIILSLRNAVLFEFLMCCLKLKPEQNFFRIHTYTHIKSNWLRWIFFHSLFDIYSKLCICTTLLLSV